MYFSSVLAFRSRKFVFDRLDFAFEFRLLTHRLVVDITGLLRSYHRMRLEDTSMVLECSLADITFRHHSLVTLRLHHTHARISLLSKYWFTLFQIVF